MDFIQEQAWPSRSSQERLLGARVEDGIAAATKALLDLQQPDGHWVFELEADATIPAEYVLFRHYRGEPIDSVLEAKIAAYLRRTQGTHGGWPLFHDGGFDMSASVKAYFALKMIGDSPDSAHMRRAREAILARGGASHVNVFTRVLLALYGIMSWRSVPVMPVEIMLLPRWFPFHLSKISYWARTVIVPLLVLMALKPQARNPKRVGISELFLEPPESIGRAPRAPHQNRGWFALFQAIDAVLRFAEPLFPKRLRRRAIDRAAAFVIERLNGVDGLGAIFPAMVNSVMMFDALGYPADHPYVATARTSVEKLLVIKEDEAYCQPCLWKQGARRLWLGPVRASNGCAHGRFSMSSAIGRIGGRTYVPADGPSSMPIHIIRISMTRRLSQWPSTGRIGWGARWFSAQPSSGRANGLRACRAATADGPPSTRTTPTRTSTIFPSPITAPCLTRRRKT
jgi:hypothetical protein